MPDAIRVVIVDDSAMTRQMLTQLLERDGAIKVVGTARDGREAIRMVPELRPDVVTMDVHMPGMDGVTTTEHLMAYCPTPILVLTASLARSEVDITFRMLGAGALEVIEKPHLGDVGAIERARRDLVRRIKVLSRVKVVTHLRGRRKQEAPPAAPARLARPAQHAIANEAPHRLAQAIAAPDFPLVIIGASTGGPRIVHRILSDLPATLPAAIVIVQHIADGFSGGLVDWLQSATTVPIALANEGRTLRAGEILVVPDQRDMLITTDGRVHLTQAPLLIQRPSIDVTMQAAAEVFGPRAIGVLLTGMGRDGAYGMLTINRRQGYTIAQNEQTCAIFGMPRAAIQLGAANEILPPEQISPRVVQLVQRLHASAPPVQLR
ncbi:MAG TPA: chemotaxis-specific protein-glutamate methyltransferase CheB [Roseiflexaceae bacterium]|nr:chemotaxis-specific protein-glutamate methyltransferase CheB [Roseiflexaceae bacterium]